MRLPILVLLVSIEIVLSRDDDRFNYRQTDISVQGGQEFRDFGPEDWGQVTCDNLDVCLGFPDDWRSAIGWELPTQTNCRWCPEGSDACGRHSMSPIRLDRNRADPDSDMYKICEDGHWMKYEEGGCDWQDMINNPESEYANNFRIERHALQILSPVDANGNLRCPSGGDSRFPRVDYPKGFPRWWHLSHTEITTKSEHFQQTKQYDAEVHLSHFYSEDFKTREIGKIAIFLQAYDFAPKWDYLDKLICQFRETEDQMREECGMPSVDPYPGCRNPSRGRQPYTPFPTQSFTPAPTPRPTQYLTPAPVPGPTPQPQTTGQQQPDTSAPQSSPTKRPFVRTLSPSPPPGPTNGQQSNPTPFPQAIPTPAPMARTLKPTDPPSATPTIISDPVAINCPAYSQMNATLVNYNRICKDGGCCDAERSDTDHCHFVYGLFGERTAEMCQQCCSPSKDVGPPPPKHPTYPEIDCRDVQQPQRICRGCCGPQLNVESPYCVDVYQTYPFEIKSICWYCCGSTPKTVGYQSRRSLRAGGENATTATELPEGDANIHNYVKQADELPVSPTTSAPPTGESHVEEKQLTQNNLDQEENDPIRAAWVRRIQLSEADSQINENFSVEDFTHMVRAYERRDYWAEYQARNNVTQDIHRHLQDDINFESVPYQAYEWMLKVKTEYFFGYEGSQAVPPCFEKVHWRVMKDPIRVHKDQITELERLLSQRIAPKGSKFQECSRDTAGVDRPGTYSGQTAVDVNRPLQQFHNFHRLEFCECQNWKSKFVGDKGWCQLDLQTRFYEHPYNFNSQWQF